MPEATTCQRGFHRVLFLEKGGNRTGVEPVAPGDPMAHEARVAPLHYSSFPSQSGTIGDFLLAGGDSVAISL